MTDQAGGGEGEARRALLEELSRSLTHAAAMLAYLAERDAGGRGPDARREAALRRVRAAIDARRARARIFGLDLASPGWSLLLELYRARLEGREVRGHRLKDEIGVPATTVLRWLDRLYARGLAERVPHPVHPGRVLIALTDAGAGAMRDYFTAAAAGSGEGP